MMDGACTKRAPPARLLASRRLPLHEQRYGKTSKLCEATTSTRVVVNARLRPWHNLFCNGTAALSKTTKDTHTCKSLNSKQYRTPDHRVNNLLFRYWSSGCLPHRLRCFVCSRVPKHSNFYPSRTLTTTIRQQHGLPNNRSFFFPREPKWAVRPERNQHQGGRVDPVVPCQ